MFKAVTIVNPKGDRLRLDIADPYSTGYNLMEMDGIGPAKATVNTSDVVTQDGVTVNGMRVDKREITLTVSYIPIPGKSVEQLRHESYKWFPEKEEISIEIETGERLLGIKGIVESNEINVFSKLEGSVVTILCPNPWFKDITGLGTQLTEFSSTIPGFHFPFANTDLVKPTLLFGVIERSLSKVVMYEGEAETGLVMTINCYGPASGIELANRDNRQIISIDTDKLAVMKEASTGKPIGKIRAGDSIVISSVRMNRYVNFVREGIATNILNAVDRELNWPTLRKGPNAFAYTAKSGGDNLSVILSNEILYAGV